MKDGVYALRFSADGYNGSGTFTLQQNRGQGHDGHFNLEGHLIEKQNKLTAVFNVLMLQHAIHNSRMPTHYSLSMTGTSSDDEFTLIGIGPLGLIIDITAQWSEPLPPAPH